MGYRSQVVIGFDKTEFWKHVGSNIDAFKDCDLIELSKTEVVFIWEDAKWYESYDDVIAVMGVFNKVLEAEDGAEKAGFLRVGEEDDDVEKLGAPYAFEIYAVTSVNTGGNDTIEHDKFFAPNSIKFIKEE